MKNLLSIAALFLMLASCSSKQEQTILILESKSKQEIDYLIKKPQFNIFTDTSKISQGKQSASERKIINIPLDKPVFILTEFNDVYYSVYLEPDNNLELAISDSSVIFLGDGANANNYLALSRVFWNKCNSDVGKYINKPPKEYGNFLDSVSTALENFNTSYLKTRSIKDKTWQILKVKNENELIVLKTIPKLVQPTAYKSIDSLPSSLLNIYANLPLDKKYLEMGMQEYFNALELYNRYEVIFPLTLDTIENDSIIAPIPIVAYENINKTDSLTSLKEFLLAKYVSYWLSEKGITPAIDSIYNNYKGEHANSKYLTRLEKQYEEFYALTHGKSAPEITGVSISGDTITLSSLKGKIVYVDVWATWCGPCIAEFPHYTSIQDKFNGNKEIIFLFVSKDSEKDKWKDYVENKMEVSGIQVLEVETGIHPSLSSSYKLWGIPHYILIDKEGKIVINKAPRPSSGKIIDEIEKLL